MGVLRTFRQIIIQPACRTDIVIVTYSFEKIF